MRPPGAREEYDEDLVRSYSVEAAAERIAAAYARVLELPPVAASSDLLHAEELIGEAGAR